MSVSRGRRKGRQLNKKEIAQIGALSSLGKTAYAISQGTGIDNHTVAKYLADVDGLYNDPKMKAAVAKYAEQEIFDLVSLTVKARARLHELVQKMNPIEALALSDRTFQQRRLLEGKSTANISTLAKIIKEANKDIED